MSAAASDRRQPSLSLPLVYFSDSESARSPRRRRHARLSPPHDDRAASQLLALFEWSADGATPPKCSPDGELAQKIARELPRLPGGAVPARGTRARGIARKIWRAVDKRARLEAEAMRVKFEGVSGRNAAKDDHRAHAAATARAEAAAEALAKAEKADASAARSHAAAKERLAQCDDTLAEARAREVKLKLQLDDFWLAPAGNTTQMATADEEAAAKRAAATSGGSPVRVKRGAAAAGRQVGTGGGGRADEAFRAAVDRFEAVPHSRWVRLRSARAEGVTKLMRSLATCICALCDEPDRNSWASFATLLTPADDFKGNAVLPALVKLRKVDAYKLADSSAMFVLRTALANPRLDKDNPCVRAARALRRRRPARVEPRPSVQGVPPLIYI